MFRSGSILRIMGLIPFAPQAIPEDFVFAPEVDDVGALPAEVKPLYTKNEADKYVLVPIMKKRLDTTGLNNAVMSERQKTKELEKLIAGFKSLGLGDTPEEALAAIEAASEAADDGTAAGDKKVAKLEEMRNKLKKEFQDTLANTTKEKDGTISKLQASLQKHVVEREAIAALAKHKGNQDLLLHLVTRSLKMVEDDKGNLCVRVIDKDGDEVGDGLGGFKTVDAHVAEMRADKKFAQGFEALGTSGSGRTPSGQTRQTHTGLGNTEAKRSIDKIAAGLEEGHADR